jgi:hypothetical protein
MRIGHPAKQRVRVKRAGWMYVLVADGIPILRSANRRETSRLAVALRRSISEED